MWLAVIHNISMTSGRMSSMFEAYCTSKLAWQLSIKFCVIHEAMNGSKKSKDSLKDCLENVMILLSNLHHCD